MKWICIFIFIFSMNQISLQADLKELDDYDWCDVDVGLKLEGCQNKLGDTINTTIKGILQSGTSCNIVHDRQTFSASCVQGIFIVSYQNESLMRLKRTAESKSVPKFGEITSIGASVGGAFGPIGGAIGAGIGLLADIFCVFFCHDDPPPPNNPPQITQYATLTVGTPIEAEEGKTTAKVAWTNATITDKEDGTLQVQEYPINFKNGGEYAEGNFVVYYTGTDKGGLSATGYLAFEVKVLRCGFPRWPDNGYIDCGGKDVIYGTSCAVRCKKGYVLDIVDLSTLKCTKSGSWSPMVPSDCKPMPCLAPPVIAHGHVQCLNNKMVFESICEAVCDDGYQVRGFSLLGCDESGQWGSVPVCQDVTPPKFLTGECPSDIQTYIDSPNNTAQVKWDEPKGIDNSGEIPIVTETHGYAPGQRMASGTHTIKYTIVDSAHNIGDSCVFSIQILSLSCSPPNLDVDGGIHLKYDCPQSYTLGAQCTLDCKSGYPMGGTRLIQCLREVNIFPPKLDWKWDDGALAPFCKETNCSREALVAPKNGALACSQWTHGELCQMQCQQGFDIPAISNNGLFVCGKSTGLWLPSAFVPSCSPRTNVNFTRLPNEFYYYTGQCNSSADNLHQIQENFVKALNSSAFNQYCVGVPECQSKFVDIICGPISGSGRKKRDIDRRSVETLAYTLRFYLEFPFEQEEGKSEAETFTDIENRLYQMSDIIQKEVDTGHFDLHIGDLQVDSSSYGPGYPEMVCPDGTVPRIETGSCVGCPLGSFLEYGSCTECPFGSYQDNINSQSCKPCPPNTNTTGKGSQNISECLVYCVKGEFSPNGLAPCTKCQSNSYQANDRATSCIKCAVSHRTPTLGATTNSECQAYDVLTSELPLRIENRHAFDSMTVFLWIKVVNSQNDDVKICFQNEASSEDFALMLYPTMKLSNGGSSQIEVGAMLSVGKWSNVALTINKRSQEIKLYLNGAEIYQNLSFATSSESVYILDVNDTLLFQGGMVFSAFHILPRIATPNEIGEWSSTCLPILNGTAVSMDDISEAEHVSIVIPSICDANDECESLPCGQFECINNIDGYECICEGGFSGLQCQNLPDFCTKNNCQNGALCINGTKNYTCSCVYGFSGDLCEKKAVDAQWSAWTEWTGCSKTCGGGLMTRSRKCDSPPPDPQGVKCTGNDIETKSCAEQICPECSTIRRTYGLIITCNETLEGMHCVISCRPGLYFTSTPLPYYECGVATGYKWNHQNDDNPTARLPACSELKQPRELGITFEGSYDSVPCTATNIQIVKENLQQKMEGIDCKMNETCETNVHDPVCKYSKKKRSIESSILVTIGFHASVENSSGSLNVADLLQNRTAATPELINLVKLTLELERSAQEIMNNSIDFFQVTVNGMQYTVQSTQLTFRPAIVCPSGTVRLEVFCVESPEGSYADGKIAALCPRGTYQDTKGQSSCKICPDGLTTLGIGSVLASDCSVSVRTSNEGSDDNKVDAVKIGVGVSLSISVLVLVVVALIFLCKYLNQRKRKVVDSAVDLQVSRILYVQSKSVFNNDLLYN